VTSVANCRARFRIAPPVPFCETTMGDQLPNVTSTASPRPTRRKRATKGRSDLDDFWTGEVLDKVANKKQKVEAPLDPEDGPGRAAIGRRVTVWWPDEECEYTGTITKFDHSAIEYCVTYEGNDDEEESQAWHDWDEIRCLGEWDGCPSPRTKVLEDLADHLVTMASTIRGTIDCMHSTRQCASENSGGSRGLLVLQSAGRAIEEDQVEPKGVHLARIAQTLQRSMNEQIKARPPGQPATTSEMKDIVTKSMNSLCKPPATCASVSHISTLTLG